MKYEAGKVYLKDTRNGQIYLYEPHLEKNPNFEACVPNPIKEQGDKEQDDKNKQASTESKAPAANTQVESKVTK